MQFKFSRCVCLQTPESESALAFYRDVLGLELVVDGGEGAELKAGCNRLFIDSGSQMGPILEIIVSDLDTARDMLVSRGCRVVVWEGKGARCYMHDPFGFLFNLYEDPKILEE